MKKMITVLAFVSLCLSFGCTLDESEPLSDESAEETTGQTEQALVYCSAWFSPTYVYPGQTTYFNIYTASAPPGSFNLVYGTRDGAQDAFGVYYPVSGAFPVVNSPGLAGSYMRYAQLRGPSGEILCQTSPTYVYLVP